MWNRGANLYGRTHLFGEQQVAVTGTVAAAVAVVAVAGTVVVVGEAAIHVAPLDLESWALLSI